MDSDKVWLALNALRNDLKPFVVGKQCPAWQHWRTSYGPATAVGVIVPCDIYVVGRVGLWRVQMRLNDKSDGSFYCKYITDFVDKETLLPIFRKHFEGTGIEVE